VVSVSVVTCTCYLRTHAYTQLGGWVVSWVDALVDRELRDAERRAGPPGR
jgi:hypothetical protein